MRSWRRSTRPTASPPKVRRRSTAKGQPQPNVSATSQPPDDEDDAEPGAYATKRSQPQNLIQHQFKAFHPRLSREHKHRCLNHLRHRQRRQHNVRCRQPPSRGGVLRLEPNLRLASLDYFTRATTRMSRNTVCPLQHHFRQRRSLTFTLARSVSSESPTNGRRPGPSRVPRGQASPPQPSSPSPLPVRSRRQLSSFQPRPPYQPEAGPSRIKSKAPTLGVFNE